MPCILCLPLQGSTVRGGGCGICVMGCLCVSLCAEGRAVSGVCLCVVGCVPVCVGCGGDGGGGNCCLCPLIVGCQVPAHLPSSPRPTWIPAASTLHLCPAILMRPGHTSGLPVCIPERVPGSSRWRVDRGQVQLAPETSASEGQGHGHTCWLPQSQMCGVRMGDFWKPSRPPSL